MMLWTIDYMVPISTLLSSVDNKITMVTMTLLYIDKIRLLLTLSIISKPVSGVARGMQLPLPPILRFVGWDYDLSVEMDAVGKFIRFDYRQFCNKKIK